MTDSASTNLREDEHLEKSLGQFGHHPDASTDFCVEVEALQGWAVDMQAGLRSQWPYWARLSALLRFVRSDAFGNLDEIAQRAKPAVLDLEGAVLTPSARPSPADRIRAALEALNEIDVNDEADRYEFRGDADYAPNDFEKTLLEDFGAGLLGKIEASLRAALSVSTPTGEGEGWRVKAAEEIEAIADLWQADGKTYALTIASIIRSEEDHRELLPPVDESTRKIVARAWDRFQAGTIAPPPPSESSREEALLTVSISVIGEESTSCHLSIAKGASFSRAEHAVARAIVALKTEYKNRFDCPAFNAEKFAASNRPPAGHSMSSMSSMSPGEKSAYYGSIVPRVLAQKERDMRSAAPWIKMEIERLRTENAQLKSAALAHPPQGGEEAPTSSIAKPDPMIEAGRERAKQCRSENCKDGYCMNWHAPHACWVRNRKGTESSGEEA